MKTSEFIYRNGDVINVIQYKKSQNSKIGAGHVVQTYHFAIDQIVNNNIKLDNATCLDCPLKFNADGISGGCYTHKGLQLLGLKSMLKRLNALDLSKIPSLDALTYLDFVSWKRTIPMVNLVRFGAYGEPIHLGEFIAMSLKNKGRKSTGYTHTWRNKKYDWSYKLFMASTHTNEETADANKRGFRAFEVTDVHVKDSVNCPASKESKKKTTCILCGLCNGNEGQNSRKNVYILKH